MDEVSGKRIESSKKDDAWEKSDFSRIKQSALKVAHTYTLTEIDRYNNNNTKKEKKIKKESSDQKKYFMCCWMTK